MPPKQEEDEMAGDGSDLEQLRGLFPSYPVTALRAALHDSSSVHEAVDKLCSPNAAGRGSKSKKGAASKRIDALGLSYGRTASVNLAMPTGQVCPE